MESKKDKLILRDTLAIDRTKLANQRTLLSYSRTGFSFIVTALAIFEFSKDGTWTDIGAWALIILGVVVMIIGFITYVKMRRGIDKCYE